MSGLATVAAIGVGSSIAFSAYNLANAPSTDIPGIGALQGDIIGFLDALIDGNPGVFGPFNDMALVNPQSPLGAMVAADIAVQLGRDPSKIGSSPTVTIFNPITGEQQQIRLPGAIGGKERAAFAAAAAPIAAAAREGRFAAIERVAAIQKDFPVATAEEMQERIQLVQGVLDSQTDQEFGRADERLLEQANLGGFSPSAGLGLLGEEHSQRSRQNDLDSIGVALALLQGEQQQAVTGLTALQNSLNSPTDRGTQLAGIESTGLANLGQQAAAQANSIRQSRTSNLQAALGLLGQRQNNAAQQAAANDVNQFNATSQFGQSLSGIGDAALQFYAINQFGQNPQTLTPAQRLALGQTAQQNRSFNFSGGAPDPLKVVPGGGWSIVR